MGILSMRKALALSPAVLLSVGCVPTFDDNLPLIDKPTVLAISAEPAEAAPGKEVQLSALVGSPDDSGATPELSWGLCIARKPLTELGPVNPVCIRAPSKGQTDLIDLGSGPSVRATLPMDACRLFGPSLPEPMNGQPAGRPVDPDPTGGYYQPISVTLLGPEVTSMGSVRIFCPPSGLDQEQGVAFNASYRNNQSPSIDLLSARIDSGETSPIPDQPEALAVAPNQVLQLEAAWHTCPHSSVCGDGVCGAGEDKSNCADDCMTPKGCTGAEDYAWFNPDARTVETRHESMRVSWFATGGHFEDAVTGRDEGEFDETTTTDVWTAPSTPGLVRAWAVIRDSRGGQSSRSFLLNVR
ncbi:MAG TPA: hypothetical protein VFK05_12215 [Polyangiaceae bacterium]|nr:hypothetical protein [Polyangiaceae bacterium]